MRRSLALIATALLSFVAAAPALGASDVATSSNWSGYAVHGGGVSFRWVSGVWRQPAPVCVPGEITYAATWVGLGGYGVGSEALEQIGTEADCDPSGRPIASAWYELVPAPARSIAMAIRPDDLMQASVTVRGLSATLRLTDRTRRTTVVKRARLTSVDITSAEWIVEAPAACFSTDHCVAMPLADFQQVRFSNAEATTTTGMTGSITNSLWDRTRISLSGSGRTFVGRTRYTQATPSPLLAAGTAFQVDYASSADAPVSASRARDVMQRTGR